MRRRRVMPSGSMNGMGTEDRGNYRRNNGGHRNNNHAPRGRTHEGKTRQQASHARDRYMGLAQEALRANDRVQSEYYFQHADHYNRILDYFDAQDPEAAYHRRPRYGRDAAGWDQEEAGTPSSEATVASGETSGEDSDGAEALPPITPYGYVPPLPSASEPERDLSYSRSHVERTSPPRSGEAKARQEEGKHASQASGEAAGAAPATEAPRFGRRPVTRRTYNRRDNDLF